MATTLPIHTRTIDNAYLQTWYEIRAEAIDNILLATPVMAMLKKRDRMTKQIGSDIITRTVKYSTASSLIAAVGKGDTLPMGEVETETMARWTWRYMAASIQRGIINDQQNAGQFRIKSYISQRMKEAREAIEQQQETDVYRATDTTEVAHKFIQSLNDIVPTFANRATGTYGLIARSNPWWQPNYKVLTLPLAVNLLSDMKNLWNTCGKNQDYPNLIITSQTMFELYEEFALDVTQIVKSGSGALADLGFETLRFKGAEMIWTPNVTTAVSGDNEMNFYNTDFLELVYDPNYWFQMTEFKPIPNQFERVAHIITTANLVSPQLRRHGALYNA